jgi:circadian clock protein KaiB
MGDIEQPDNSADQAQHGEDVYELKLYVVGNSRKSQLAFENLKKVCRKYLAGKCHIEVIDLTKNPSLAIKDQIIAIPTLIMKNYTGKRIVGDFSNLEKVLELFDLQSSTIKDALII